ncbi:Type I restriction-modification system, specificity subunit S [Methanosarcina sp. Kolksee]|uniref:restriction endonuclease subunit S n=1 Tax=Methanosarcina sp. Kolksee TaxID=1434099 RepID=UPI00061591E4|nr:restriction endonuclease subunit S [Methanosarcina sp. Kolksee]AKB47615.1 Type I restriction-modification system, specificity subunit S [Methanosarcina sp. Kolksee]
MSPWPAIELSKVAEIAAGGSAPQNSNDFCNIGTPFVRAGSLKPLIEGAVESSLELLSEDVAKKHRLRLFPAGSVLFAKSGMSATKGHVYRLISSAYVVNHLAAIICGPNLDSGYLRHCLQVFSPTRLIQDEAYPSIRLSNIASMKIPLPHLEEQKRIADILDRAEAIRAKRRTSLDQLDELTQAIFIDMFGGHAMKEWPVTTVASVAHPGKGSIRTGPFGSQLLHSEFVDEGIAVLGIDNAVSNEFQWGARRFISEAKYKELKRYTVRPGDVLITIMGTCGRCAVVPDDIPIAINTKHLCCITLNQEKCIPIYLHAYFLRHPIAQHYLAQTAKGAIMAGLNMEIIKKMPISIPPLILQKEFASRVEAINKIKTSHKNSLADLDELFASLQYRAFRGELSMIPKTNEQSFEGIKI